MDLKARIRTDLEAVGGRHDELDVYGGEPGDLGLCGGPDSLSWEINGDLASVAAAGMAAIIMEVLHPSVMSGVHEQSNVKQQPFRRAQNTLGYVLRTTFGSAEAATDVVLRVKRVHARVNGTRPDGVAYRALDPELIAWVHTCIPWAIMEAFHRYNRQLTTDERDRYLAEQAVIGILSGAEWVPTTVAELKDYAEHMRPLLAMTEQLREFIGFLAGDSDGEFGRGSVQQLTGRLDIAASMSLMPAWARQLTGTYLPDLLIRPWGLNTRFQCATIRFAYPDGLPCKKMAMARATAVRKESTEVAAAR